MTALSLNQLQHRYRDKKLKLGWKRIQIWKLDENNKEISQCIKQGSSLANNSKDEQNLVDEIMKHSNKLLKDIPL
jgi:hypothetical protein